MNVIAAVSEFHQAHFGQTLVNPIALAIVLICGIAMLLVPRRFAVWPFIAVCCFIAPAQRIAIFGVNFDMLRIMVLFGVARLAVRGEWNLQKWLLVDYLVILWAGYAVFATMIVHGSMEALKYECGIAFDLIGMYFFFRCVVRNWEDISSLVLGFAVASIPTVLAFLIENSTVRKIFGFMGGVPDVTLVRDGRLRCQGPFGHPILAGCFWAATLPLLVARWWDPKCSRTLTIVASAAAFFTVILTASGTPATALAFLIAGTMLYPFRGHMRTIRWGALIAVICLHLVMKAPVWSLLGRFTLVSGSTGFHRVTLIDAAIDHFHEWGFIGSNVGTGHWGYFLVDVTNMYVAWGVHGGIGLLGLFLWVIFRCFGGVGRLLRINEGDPPRRAMSWALGLALFTHVASFIGVSYWGQINMVWYLHLAIIASLVAHHSVNTAPRHRQGNGNRVQRLEARFNRRRVTVT